MTDRIDHDLETLEQDIGNKLHSLPKIEPDIGFQKKLWEKLAVKYTESKTSYTHRKKNKNIFVKMGVIAASIILIVTLTWQAFYNPQKEVAFVEPLFFNIAQASSISSGFTFGTGFTNFREIDFEFSGMPAAPEKGQLIKLKKNNITTKDALDLARAVGMKNPEVIDEPESLSMPFFITDSAEKNQDQSLRKEIVVWREQGIWTYISPESYKHGENSKIISEEDAQDIAINWLEKADLLPQDGFDVIIKKPVFEEDATMIVILVPKFIEKFVGETPKIQFFLSAYGDILYVYWNFPTPDSSFEIPFASYEEALTALERGEGVFEAVNFTPKVQGSALIKQAEVAYQLAYSVDHTPYLVPSAVFYGEYTSEHTTENFKAYVPLTKRMTEKNCGNFSLESEFPIHKKTAKTIKERNHEVTKQELKEIAKFFNLVKQEPEDIYSADTYLGTGEEELSFNSWDGGWLYRPNRKVEKGEDITNEKAIEIAEQIANDLPVLPGDLGKGQVIYTGPGTGIYVTFPLLYDGLPVVCINSPGYISSLSVQLGYDGELWSIKCALPMELVGEEIPTLPPKQAWEKLVKNDYLISIDGFFGFMPGDRFTADKSEVEDIRLVYIPRHPEFARSKEYDLVYEFSGTAWIGKQKIKFSAYVDALK
ncbi:MAG TPA: hypothetical protein GXZ31_04065 [Thermoanaerobacterales bacterium]|nr:hypothetical protein [Thermoanaerobacterales bacterium]